ncbi:MAG TPA: hypothetical protein VHG28_07680 [Longimicrobiaceae bacterium]|nr:hypothetical protein [Longimicrobiaceae bacterium]
MRSRGGAWPRCASRKRCPREAGRRSPPGARAPRDARRGAAPGRRLGHPLGGNGTEWLAYGAADLLDARLRLAARVYFRERGEDNLYAPTWEGRSRGGAVSFEWAFGDAFEGFGGVEVEDGRGWERSAARAGVRVRY